MGKSLFSFLFSPRLMAVLLVVFAVSMGIATFIENDYNTDTARVLVYNTWWFEAIMVMLAINFLGNINRYQLWRKEKWASLLLHLSFLLILFGAFWTRYISFEGMMPIREGNTENVFYSDKAYLTVLTDGEYQGETRRRTYEEPLILSQAAPSGFTMKKDFNDIPFEVEFEDFIMNASEQIIEDPNGAKYLKIVETHGEDRHEHFLKEGELQQIHNVLYAYNKPTDGAINVMETAGVFTIKMPWEGNFMRMADQFTGKVEKDSIQPLMFRSLYSIEELRFVFPDQPIKGRVDYVSNNDYKDKSGTDVLRVKVSSQGKSEIVTLSGSKGRMGEPQSITIDKLDFTLFFGSKVYELPFQVRLNDFIAEKYPGTEKSYSSFESQVTVIDPEKTFDYRIYMNHVLDHKGYRFFQANFDPDEKGTVLSVSHDFIGTWITYIGYALLYIGLLGVFFTKHTRFGELRRKLETVQKKKAKLLSVILLFLSFGVVAQPAETHTHEDGTVHQGAHHTHEQMAAQPADSIHQANQEQVISRPVMPTDAQRDSIITKFVVSKEHADRFGRLVIQDHGGRMKPIHTFSSELLRKVTKQDNWRGMDSDQVFLNMLQVPMAWFQEPMIYLKRGNDSIRHVLNIAEDAKYASFLDFFDEQGNYKLAPFLEQAHNAIMQTQFQKDYIDADRKVNLLNSALMGGILRIYPIPNDENFKWVSHMELNEVQMPEQEANFTKNIFPIYMMSLQAALQTGNYKEADYYLDGISRYQHTFGEEVMPSDQKIEAEVLYNKIDIFNKLFQGYLFASVVMLALCIVQIFNSRKGISKAISVMYWIIVALVVLHTLGLAARWYISGHAPWSDAYESMIYVAWATVVFSVFFSRKSSLTVASGTFVGAMVLMVAHWNWMDPAIANLQPVLDSYWLMIHVAVIVGSYGPFTLGMILGLVALILMLFVNDKNRQKIDLSIKEITYINEMALTIGLVMLTIGNFLGGQWANESWGRYWGWDPKETWALISIIVYAFVIHMRFIPGMKNRWIFNVMSVFAFYSILMTYFGVNFYLSGLHSYASGDKVVTPTFIYISVAVVLTITIASYFAHKRLEKR